MIFLEMIFSEQLGKYILQVLVFLFVLPLYAKSTSNKSNLNVSEACPALPEKALGQGFIYKLHLQKTTIENRYANIWYDSEKKISETKTTVFYWHGTNGNTEEINVAMGQKGVQELVDRGYIVVSPDHIRNADGSGTLDYSWYIANGSRLNHDVIFGDLIVQCLNAKFKTNFKVITTGFSAGAMQSALWSFQNKDIIGTILYSGGIFHLPQFVPRQNFWSVITHGGITDVRGDFNFMNTGIHIHNKVLQLRSKSALCDFTPQGHGIHKEITNIFTDIIFDQENILLPKQCSKDFTSSKIE